jgi:type I restriction enzyme, S subunit
MAEWRETSLGEVMELKRGYDLPRQNRVAGPIPLISSSGLTDYHAVSMVKGPGVVTGRYGTLGKVFYVREDFWPLNTTLYVRDFKGNNPRYISYLLECLDFSAYSDKAAVPGLNRNHLHEARVRIPLEISEQEAIASTLGALDDKIELNQRQCKTLEITARAVFKDWFVEFGPVRAKLAGQASYLSSDFWSRFPSELAIDGRPKGWTMKPLAQLTSKIGSGATPTGGSQVYVASGTALIRSQNVYDDEFAWDGLVRMREDHAEKLKGVTVYEGDILINITGDSILRCCVVDPAVLPARVNQHVAIVRTRPEVSNRFVQQYLTMPRTKETLIGFDAGGSRAAVTKAHLEALPVLFPGEQVLAAFEGATAPLFNGVAACNVESRILADLRKLLLPKLISGEIRVKDTERIAGEQI